ncbi:HAMP domain-containing sensor histidine kinase [Roseovarius sp. SK2]|uniref:sensor histidine kinase n=1 Tax=Roseovarius sp. SK2 TaxID=3028381 RepID=UPI00237B397F|nr:HAMP domain-containing sensor histidine kinase [Roseovarius sp. SK2]MDD9727565.1 HAMP domain-containing sensor histidine kinase [Roseovarius sp. SK2]
MTRDNAKLAYGVAGTAIVAFAVLLVFALLRLIDTEAEMRKNEGDNMLWAISQTQSAALLLDSDIARKVGVPGATTDLERRYNVLLSRLTLLSEGPQLRYMGELGLNDALSSVGEEIRALEAAILVLEFGDTGTAEAVHAILNPLIRSLGLAGNRSMVRQWEATGTRLDRQHNAIMQVIISIIALIALGLFLSVTMLRAMAGQERFMRSFEREQQVADAYRSFVALVSHQFRTPLSVIDSSMQRLLRSGEAMSRAEVVRRAAQTRAEVKTLNDLIGATLDVIRLEAGQITPNPAPCEVSALVEQVRTRELATSPKRVIEISIGDEVPPSIHTDPLLADQILTNLLSNAIKYSPDTEPVTIRISAANRQILFAIEDLGVGIPEDEQERLFERFFRASTAQGMPGTGVGLSIAFQLAVLLGGELKGDSRAGYGSVFTLALPDEWPGCGKGLSREASAPSTAAARPVPRYSAGQVPINSNAIASDPVPIEPRTES